MLARCTRLLAVACLLAAAVGVAGQTTTLYPMQSVCPHTATSLRLKNWNTASSWTTGSVPATGAAVTIPSNTSILIDASVLTLASITVFGTLVLRDAPLNLITSFIRVESGGAFLAGSDLCRLTSRVNITFTGARNLVTDSTMGTEPADGTNLGSKGFALVGGSSLQLFGVAPSPVWTNLATTAVKGATTITLKQSVNWKQGDRLLITSTDYNMDTYYADQNEEVYVQSVSGNVVTLTAPLKWGHWGANYQYAEVAILNRNFVLTGDAGSDASQFGGHLIMRKVKYAQIGAIEFTKFGQRGLLGRYPVHFHMQGDQRSGVTYLKESSIHHNYQRCAAIHDSVGVQILNNVAAYTNGHCYFLEDGSEELNVFDHNLGVAATSVDTTNGGYGLILPTDVESGMFWITNANNTWINNVAVSAFHGFWFAMAPAVNGLSKAKYAADTRLSHLRYVPLLLFKGNTAHSNDDTGFMIDDMQTMDGQKELAAFNPRVLPPAAGLDPSTYDWTLPKVWVTFSGLLGYKNRVGGWWSRGSYIVLENSIWMDNLHGVLQVPGPQVGQHMLIVGESDNIGDPSAYTDPDNWLPAYGTRSRPTTWTNSYPLDGWRAYDASGPQFARNITLQNFVTNSYRPAGGIGQLPNGPNILMPQDMLVDFKFINAQTMYIEQFPNAYDTSLMSDGPKSLQLRDMDGSITGYTDGWLISSNQSAFILGAYPGKCTLQAAWKTYVCPPFNENFVGLRVINKNTATTNFGTTVTGKAHIRSTWYRWGTTFGGTEGMPMKGAPESADIRTQYDANVLDRQGYHITFPHATPPSIEVSFLGGAQGDWVMFSIAYPPPPTGTACSVFTLTYGYDATAMTCVTTLAAVGYGSFFYDTEAQNLIVRVQLAYERDDVTILYPAGFVEYGSSDAFVTISTSHCTGSSCMPSKTVIPAVYKSTEDLYLAQLDPCQVKTFDGSFKADGRAVFRYEPNSHMVTYYITHNLDLAATSITLYSGTNTKVLSLPTLLSPSRGAFRISRDQLGALYRGELWLQITTAAKPNGVLRGALGCSGTCALPPSQPAMAPCTPTKPAMILFNGNTAQQPKWISHSWGVTDDTGNILMTEKTDLLCGTATLKFLLGVQNDNVDSALRLYNDGDVNEITADLSIHTHVVFWLKMYAPIVLTTALQFTFYLYVDDGVATPPFVTVAANDPKYLASWIPTGDWSRVAIPLADLGFTATNKIFNGFQFENEWNTEAHWVAIDGMILTSITGKAMSTVTDTVGTYAPAPCASSGRYGITSSSSSSTGTSRSVKSSSSSTGASSAKSSSSSTGSAKSSSSSTGSSKSSSSSTGITKSSSSSSSTAGTKSSSSSSSTGGGAKSSSSSSSAGDAKSSSSTGSFKSSSSSTGSVTKSSTGVSSATSSSSTGGSSTKSSTGVVSSSTGGSDPTGGASSSSTGSSVTPVTERAVMLTIRLATPKSSLASNWSTEFVSDVSDALNVSPSRVLVVQLREDTSTASAVVAAVRVLAAVSSEGTFVDFVILPVASVDDAAADESSATDAGKAFEQAFTEPTSFLMTSPSLAMADASVLVKSVVVDQCTDGSWSTSCSVEETPPTKSSSGSSSIITKWYIFVPIIVVALAFIAAAVYGIIRWRRVRYNANKEIAMMTFDSNPMNTSV